MISLKRRNFVTIQDENLKDMALSMSSSCGITDFVASSGWLRSFKKRHQIRSKMVIGESGMVDSAIIEDFATLYYERNTVQ